MSDIVERLRAGDTLDIGEAADEIERLRAESTAFKTSLLKLGESYAECVKTVERLRAALEEIVGKTVCFDENCNCAHAIARKALERTND